MSTLPPEAEQFIHQHNSPNTRSAYVLDLSKWFRFLGDRAPSVAVVLAWKDQLEGSYAQNSARRIFTTVGAFYDWCRRAGIIERNPFELVKRPPEIEGDAPRVPTDVQVERILRAVDRRSPAGKRHYAILCLLLNGLRAQEVCDLRMRDYFTDEATDAPVLRVVGKGMHERIVPLTPEANDALVSYLQDQLVMGNPHGKDDYLLEDVFPGRPITRKQVAFACEKYGKLAGVRGFTPHSFRHHYATRLYRVTRDVLGVGKLLGHKKTETTKRYARLDLADLVETARLDPRYDTNHAEARNTA